MIKQDLLDYVHRQFQHGHDTATIKEHLLTHGYIPEIAEEAIKRAKNLTKAKEQNHIEAKEHKHKQMHIPFSAPSIAFLFVCVALFGMSMYWGSQSLFIADLAGAATEPVEELSQVEETFEVDAEISIIDEETPENEIDEQPRETETQEIVMQSETCTASTCQTGVCYQQQCQPDNDKDTISDMQEIELGTDRLDQDTDDDGLFDGEEVEKGTDPLNVEDPGVVYCATVKDCKQGEGCNENGICTACIDSDESNYKIKGTTSGVHYTNNKAMISTDYCSDGVLLEFYCRNEGYLFYQNINCELEFGEGYYCSEGRCMR